MSCTRQPFVIACIGIALGGIAAPTVHADLIGQLGNGLALTGFNVTGNRNVLSGGVDLQVSNNFLGNPLDFGFADLTLRGPISFDFATGRRLIPTLDVSLRSAFSDTAAAVPISTAFNADIGVQSTRASGTVLVDVNFSLNGLGFYDLALTYSSREEIERSGFFANDTSERDSDIGPINVSGNIFADVLSVVTEPVFQAIGAENPFASLGDPALSKEILQLSSLAALTELAEGLPLLQENVLGQIVIDAITGTQPRRQTLSSAIIEPASGRSTAIVPEPAVVVLLVAAMAVAAARRRQSYRPRPPAAIA